MIGDIPIEGLRGVWSATPTPFTEDMRIDVESVERMVEHHLRLGVKGLFIAGTCGEGAWMPDRDRRVLVQTIAEGAEGRLALAVQVTDNSATRVLDNIALAQEDGADVAVIAQPYFLLNATPDNMLNLYTEAIGESPLPVGFYDRGRHAAIPVPEEILDAIYGQENLAMVKDSSGDPTRREMALAARDRRPELLLLNGDEFNCVQYVRAGYDGLLLGGGIFNGHLAGLIIKAVQEGDPALAEQLQARMNRIMYDVYGGEDISCWLSGQKKLLVQMGVFGTWRSYLNYPLTEDCVKAIEKVLEEDADVLFPWEGSANG
jgi:4-hydroxy-tetrahydrodipicolinate synthase